MRNFPSVLQKETTLQIVTNYFVPKTGNVPNKHEVQRENNNTTTD